jgi:hypothetical protein
VKWPWPRDSREDRAKRVALSYRHALQVFAEVRDDAAAALLALDVRWSELGAGWVRPTLVPLDLDAWVDAAAMAELFHQDPRTIYDWGRRGNIRVRVYRQARHYNVGDIVTYQAQRRLRRPVDACATMREGQTAPKNGGWPSETPSANS